MYSIGVITSIFPVYNKRGYVDIVSRVAELSMQAAVEEVQALVHYESDGEVHVDVHVHVVYVHVHVDA